MIYAYLHLTFHICEYTAVYKKKPSAHVRKPHIIDTHLCCFLSHSLFFVKMNCKCVRESTNTLQQQYDDGDVDKQVPAAHVQDEQVCLYACAHM